jgi:hypothetical protein
MFYLIQNYKASKSLSGIVRTNTGASSESGLWRDSKIWSREYNIDCFETFRVCYSQYLHPCHQHVVKCWVMLCLDHYTYMFTGKEVCTADTDFPGRMTLLPQNLKIIHQTDYEQESLFSRYSSYTRYTYLVYADTYIQPQ